MLSSLGRQNEAVAAFDRTLAIRPTASAWTNRGVALKALGRAADAVDSFDSALALDMAFPAALYNRGIALLELGRFADALAAFDQLLTRVLDDHLA